MVPKTKIEKLHSHADAQRCTQHKHTDRQASTKHTCASPERTQIERSLSLVQRKFSTDTHTHSTLIHAWRMSISVSGAFIIVLQITFSHESHTNTCSYCCSDEVLFSLKLK